MTPDVDTVVVGAGVVGLAVARALALRGRAVMVLERHGLIGSETSSRNSEVIHAGIYYDAGSLKAITCIDGKRRLYDFLKEHGVAHRRLGKLIVATAPEQLPVLADIRARAAANGVDDLEMLSKEQAGRLEPALACHGALLSPSTGILDSHGYMLALQGEFEATGGEVVPNADVAAIEALAEGYRLTMADGFALACRCLVVASGLWSSRLMRTLRPLPTGYAVPETFYAKGNYFSLAVTAPFSRLIYPVPEPGGLGVHLTLDMAGRARFGPDVEWLDVEEPEAIDYRVAAERGSRFYEAIRRYWPALPDGALLPDYAGVRPKLGRAGAAAGDFLLHGPAEHGLPGLVALYGIESPGLTASLAIADRVAGRLV